MVTGFPVAALLQDITGYCDTTLYDFQMRQMPMVVAIITRYLDRFLDFSRHLLQRDAD
jgi:hypothetical protein